MAKRKNQGAEKRREAKKRKNSIKRKAQVRSATMRDIQTEYPTEYLSVNKLSEVILDYAEPLLRGIDDYQKEIKAIGISITFWNVSLLPKQEALEAIDSALGDMLKGDPQLKNDLYTIYEMMYKRKQNQFSNDKRFVVDYSLDKIEGGFNLQVSSTSVEK